MTSISNRTLSITQTASDAISLVIRHRGFLWRAGGLAILAAVAGLSLADWAMAVNGVFSSPSETISAGDLVKNAIDSLITVACVTPLAIAWHRNFLALRTGTPTAAPTMHYMTFAFVVEALSSLLFTLPFLMASKLPAWGTIAAVLASFGLLIMLSRFSLALPAMATGQPSTLAAAWNLTRGNAIRLMLSGIAAAILSVIVLLPVMLPVWVFVPEQTAGGAVNVVNIIITSLFAVICTVFGISFLTAAYRNLTASPAAEVSTA